MHCPKCDKKIDEDSKFCKECGEALLGNEKKGLGPTSQGQRFLNFLLDMIFYFILAFIFGIVIGIFGSAETIENSNGTLFGFVLTLGYYLFFETIYGKSIAKFITKTKVVNKDGSKPTLLAIFWRSLARFIPFDPFSFCTGNNPIGWHDSLSKTIVVDDK